MGGCKLGAKLALIAGVIISRMAPVSAMVIKIFFMIDSIWSNSNDRVQKMMMQKQCRAASIKIRP